MRKIVAFEPALFFHRFCEPVQMHTFLVDNYHLACVDIADEACIESSKRNGLGGNKVASVLQAYRERMATAPVPHGDEPVGEQDAEAIAALQEQEDVRE